MLQLFGKPGKRADDLPSPAEVRSFTDQVTVKLFPLIEGGRQKETNPFCSAERGGIKSMSGRQLKKKLTRVLTPLGSKLPDSPSAIAFIFLNELPAVLSQAESDARFIAEGDPASDGVGEVIMAYPGFYAILVYRLANILHRYGVPVVPRIMTEYAHSRTGIDIHPGATIGNPFFIDHGTGIVIGETARIGNKVKMYQGVTIGALSVSKSAALKKRHPTIEDNVIIYAGSTILGGDTVIGHHSIIGGNVWLTSGIPPYSFVCNESEVKIRERPSSKKD